MIGARPRPRRLVRPLTAAAAAILVLAGCTSDGASPPGDRASPSGTDSSATEEPTGTASAFARRVACGLPHEWLQRIANGYDPERSGDLEILPDFPNFVGAGLPHVGPWPITSDVPMFWYGPGYIKPLGPVQQPADLPDIMATWDHLLGSTFEPPDGEPLTDALVPAEERPEPPRLLIMMVWDGAGRAVLDRWSESWPNLAKLRAEGAWFEHATVGSSPTSSAQIHATFGTAAYPSHHGVPGHTVRIDGELVSPWKRGPFELELDTFADHFDAEHGNEPLVGMSGSVAIQLGMMSHGSYLDGGDKDLAVLRTPGQGIIEGLLGAEGKAWNIPEEYLEWYEMPPYVNDLPRLASYFDDVDLDARDGARDGTWHGHPFEESEELLNGFHTPARIPYQTRLIEELITREGFGDDEVTDLFFVNYKLIDTLGHLYGLEDETMRDAVATQDQYLPPFIDFLNEEVGQGRWALVMTADHGSLESAEASGAFQISAEQLHGAIQGRFDEDDDDTPVVEQVKQTEIFMNVEELEEHVYTLDDVSRFIMGLRQSQLQIPGLPVRDPDAEAFQAAFPAEALLAVPCL